MRLSAIRAHDLARERGGRFLLRIEDIDGGRSRPEHVAGISRISLAGAGLGRSVLPVGAAGASYQAALDGLNARGLLYPLFLHAGGDRGEPVGAAWPRGRGLSGTCRRLAPARSRRGWARRIAGGSTWRAALSVTGPLAWADARAGTVRADPAAQGDVVLARKDAPASYHLAVTLDDAAQGVTDVVRGDDLFAATDVHRLLQALLGLPRRRFIIIR